MAVALRNGASGALEQFKSGESLQIDQLERLAGSGHLVIGSALGATDELQLGSVASVVRVLGDFDVDGAMASDLDMNGNDVLNAGNLVNTVFGRVGNVAAAASDYDASQIDNDSSVTGTYVSDALNNLLTALGAACPASRNLTAGAGLTGGGDLTADRTFNVVANADGSIAVNADDIQVGVLSNDTQHGARGGGTQHAVATTGANGFMSSTDKTKLDGLPASPVPDSRNLTAGAGLTGGGDLSADRTFDVAANVDGSVVVNANDIQVGVLATDAQHGARGGGTQHVVATTGTAGFMSGADKTKLDGLPSSPPPDSRNLTAGAGLTGGGDLSADRTFDVVANADGSVVVNANDIQVGVLASDAQHGTRGGGTQHASATTGANGFMSAGDKTKLDGLPSSAVPTSRNLTAGAGLTGGGDLSADRTFNAVANADGSIVVNADDIQVGVLATNTQHGVRGGGTQHAIATTSVNGFMSGADKTKLDGLPSAALPLAGGTMAGNIDMANYDVLNVRALTFNGIVNKGSQSTAVNFDFDDGQKQRVTMTGNLAITLTPLATGKPTNMMIELIQDGTGSRTPTWPSNARATDGEINVSSAGGSTTIVGVYYDGSLFHLTSSPNSAGSVTTTLV